MEAGVAPAAFVCQRRDGLQAIRLLARAWRLGYPTENSLGYVRFIDIDRLVILAKSYGVVVRVVRRVGHFVPAGVPLLMVSKGERLSTARCAELRGAFDLGPTRTLQQDVEFGILQIVDIALRAISPAVNDPSTAINCVDRAPS